jgi:hypothetical protein
MRLRCVERLDNALWSFLLFFSHDGIFMALAMWRRLWWCVRERRQLIKPWAAHACVGPSAFTINVGAEAQTSSRQSTVSA